MSRPKSGRAGQQLVSEVEVRGDDFNLARATCRHGPRFEQHRARYSHQIAGQLARDAVKLDEYLNGEAATVVELHPVETTGAHAGAQQAETA